MIRQAIEIVISKIKGKDYKIDKSIKTRAFFEIVFFRLISILRFLIKFRNIKISFVGRNVDLRNKKNILIGNGVTIEDGVTINALSNNPIVLSDNVTICKNTIIQGSGVITELGEGVFIGAGSGIGAMSFIGCQGGVYIGENVIMGPRISIHSENHNYSDPNQIIKDQGVSRLGVKINNNCWIGTGATILDGVEIGEGCVIAAGAVVTKSIPRNSLVAGIPAKVIKSRIL